MVRIQVTMAGAHLQQISDDARHHFLLDSRYALTRASVLSALRDSRPNVRSLAAQELSAGMRQSDLMPMMQAWIAESDHCTKFVMFLALQRLLRGLSQDVKQHPSGSAVGNALSAMYAHGPPSYLADD
jgi:hypothetical protein